MGFINSCYVFGELDRVKLSLRLVAVNMERLKLECTTLISCSEPVPVELHIV